LAPLSNGGYAIEPIILSSVNISSGQWVILPSEEKQALIKPEKAAEIARFLSSDEEKKWGVSAITYDSNGAYSWYALGTHYGSSTTPIVITVVIEAENREKCQSIGKEIFDVLNF